MTWWRQSWVLNPNTSSDYNVHRPEFQKLQQIDNQCLVKFIILLSYLKNLKIKEILLVCILTAFNLG